MTFVVSLYGSDVVFSDKAPTVDGAYWFHSCGVCWLEEVCNGYTLSGRLPSEESWFFSERLAPAIDVEKAKTALLAITSGHFYQSSCRGGEMERLMNQAIEFLAVQ